MLSSGQFIEQSQFNHFLLSLEKIKQDRKYGRIASYLINSELLEQFGISSHTAIQTDENENPDSTFNIETSNKIPLENVIAYTLLLISFSKSLYQETFRFLGAIRGHKRIPLLEVINAQIIKLIGLINKADPVAAKFLEYNFQLEKHNVDAFKNKSNPAKVDEGLLQLFEHIPRTDFVAKGLARYTLGRLKSVSEGNNLGQQKLKTHQEKISNKESISKQASLKLNYIKQIETALEKTKQVLLTNKPSSFLGLFGKWTDSEIKAHKEALAFIEAKLTDLKVVSAQIALEQGGYISSVSKIIKNITDELPKKINDAYKENENKGFKKSQKKARVCSQIDYLKSELKTIDAGVIKDINIAPSTIVRSAIIDTKTNNKQAVTTEKSRTQAESQASVSDSESSRRNSNSSTLSQRPSPIIEVKDDSGEIVFRIDLSKVKDNAIEAARELKSKHANFTDFMKVLLPHLILAWNYSLTKFNETIGSMKLDLNNDRHKNLITLRDRFKNTDFLMLSRSLQVLMQYPKLKERKQVALALTKAGTIATRIILNEMFDIQEQQDESGPKKWVAGEASCFPSYNSAALSVSENIYQSSRKRQETCNAVQAFLSKVEMANKIPEDQRSNITNPERFFIEDVSFLKTIQHILKQMSDMSDVFTSAQRPEYSFSAGKNQFDCAKHVLSGLVEKGMYAVNTAGEEENALMNLPLMPAPVIDFEKLGI